MPVKITTNYCRPILVLTTIIRNLQLLSILLPRDSYYYNVYYIIYIIYRDTVHEYICKLTMHHTHNHHHAYFKYALLLKSIGLLTSPCVLIQNVEVARCNYPNVG